MTYVAAPPSLCQYHLANEWTDYMNGIPQSIVIAAPIDDVEQPQFPVLFLASCPDLLKYIFTLRYDGRC